MAAMMILEFEALDSSTYDAVNKALGIDPHDPASDWPAGMLSHQAGATDNGGWAVVETWDSQASQGGFMESRLGPALGGAGVAAQPRVTWIDLVTDTRIG